MEWIPANNPFATTVNNINQDFAQKNVYQKDGVPFWLRAEHEAMQRNLDALQNESFFLLQTINKFQEIMIVGSNFTGEVEHSGALTVKMPDIFQRPYMLRT
ncbi:unnamed protein product [Eruca vesicaria subsp. sativa]|uniref:Uncharacterized protein n=1 Tax=Eruca vesicaria subsp. sativa TaxID=29727 RepID=A0ABC8JLV6_ERUVS|nr:unnamed protein product [Eruca vesicaria subsp. sativa]